MYALQKKIKKTIGQIIVRAERQSAEMISDSFYDFNIIEHLENMNHQIVQGRRGTGKTHILKVLKDRFEREYYFCFYFDCKATGSAAEVANDKFPDEYRVVQLVKDFLISLRNDLNGYFFDIRYPEKEWINSLLRKLHNECFSSEEYEVKFERTTKMDAKISSGEEKSKDFSLSLKSFFGFSSRKQKDKEKGAEVTERVSGIKYRNIDFTKVYACINDLTRISKAHFVILIDEWSSLPISIQPHFAEFIKRCLMPCPQVTIKMATVEARTNLSNRNTNNIYGLEVGADIPIAIDLDRLYMFDLDANKISTGLYNILLRHLMAHDAVDSNFTENDLASILFHSEGDNAKQLLARASEGNPRDFISIVHQCYLEMDRDGDSDYITTPIIFRAANSWYILDKHNALSLKQQNLLFQIFMYVVRERENRGFVIDENYLRSSPVYELVDARVLHVLQTGRVFSDLGNRPMAIVVLDFGTYSQELCTKFPIHFLINDECEDEVFGKNNSFLIDSIPEHKLDAKRYFRVCNLDQKFFSTN